MKEENIITEIKTLYESYLERHGKSSLRVSNKEFNLWIANKLIEQDGRIIRLETRQKLLFIIITGLLLKVVIV